MSSTTPGSEPEPQPDAEGGVESTTADTGVHEPVDPEPEPEPAATVAAGT